MKQWVCSPLKSVDQINDRLDALEDLTENSQVSDLLGGTFKNLPDLQRMLSRIHSGSTSLCDLLSFLDAFELVVELVYGELSEHAGNFKSKRLNFITSVNVGSNSKYSGFPDIQECFSVLSESFNRKAAQLEGKIIPEPGFYEDYDEASAVVKKIEDELAEILKQQQKHFKTHKVVYKDLGKEPYQIEVPLDVLKNITPPSNYTKISSTQKVQRFYLPSVKVLIPQLAEAKEELRVVECSLLQSVFKKIDENCKLWSEAIDLLAEMDCLLSFSVVSTSSVHGLLPYPSPNKARLAKVRRWLHTKQCCDGVRRASKCYLDNRAQHGW
eukprot:TRINITY_DN8910_c0_g1_i3.p1 TRINITY_DN8910_c0_g1~~TRINITY_DN8910_c0_g1_i3.p1  ORF type:complete len:326 (-),score=68.15 TRINITY_DN8910_c0_g1_i3:406-1383(-)